MRMFFLKTRKLFRIILFIIIYSLLPIIGLTFYMSLGQRELAFKMAKEEVNHMVNQIYLNEKELMARTETFLFVLSQYRNLKTQDKKNCNEILPLILKKTNYFKNIFVVDIHGNVYCSGLPLKEKINVSDRKYFVNTVANRRFSLGDYQIGRASKRPVWVAGYPIFNDDDVLIGIVAVSIDLEWLSNLLSTNKLPPKSVLKVFDDKGVILASYPDKSQLGKKQINNKEISYVVSGKKSPVELKGSDGIDRIYAFKEFESSATDEKKFIMIGVDKSFIKKPIDEIFKRSLILTLFVTFFVIIIAFINWRLFIYPEIIK